jgi:hypothetical protein
MPWPRVVSDAQSTLRSAAVCTPHAYPFGPAKTAAIGRVLSSSRKTLKKNKDCGPRATTVLLGLQIGQLREYSMRLLIPTAE